MSAFGIDFGTTNTTAAELDKSQFRDYGYELKPLPSVIALDLATGRALVGAAARTHILEHEEQGNYIVIRSIKTLLDSEHTWHTERKTWTPAMVTAAILGELSSQVTLEGGISAATFSVPVGVRPSAITVLREAAQLANIKVNGVIKESTAAIFRHLSRVRHCRYVAVFDWGGGTLDVSVLEIRGKTIYERYTAGMARAGDRVDDDIARRIHPKLVDEAIAFDDMHGRDRDQLLVQCELAKRALSTKDAEHIQLKDYGGKTSIYRVTRQFCRPAIEPIVLEALHLLDSAISSAGLSPDAIDQIIVIGGSSRLWLLRELIEADERFANRSYFSENPEWDVARGAAIVDASPGCYSLAETIGLELSDGCYFELVRPGDRIDGSKHSIRLALVEDVQAANVVLDRWEDSAESRHELAEQFTVETQGFDLEAVELSWQLTENLTLEVEGKSHARGNDGDGREITRLRFGYDIEPPVEKQSSAPFKPLPQSR